LKDTTNLLETDKDLSLTDNTEMQRTAIGFWQRRKKSQQNFDAGRKQETAFTF
jgi:hypothetical protein